LTATLSPQTLGSVQKTLLLPLWGRAAETRKPKPLLADRAAAEIVGKLDYDFTAMSARLSFVTQLAWIARSVHIDRTIRTFVDSHPRAAVVNIGCGLDTTFERVDNGTLTWVDLDLPDVIRLRAELVPEGPRRTSIASSVLDDQWLGQIEREHGVMFVAAGVLYYFDEAEVRALLSRIAAAFPGAEMICDVCSPFGVKVANKRVIRDGGMDESAVLKWGIERARDLASWDARIEIVDAHPLFRGFGRSLSWRERIGMAFSDALNIMSMAHVRFAAR
jgi:O-methyltransferase involved in polyketide biosynthesis